MRRVLVIANRTLAGAHLVRAIRDRLAEGPCHVHVLVPATPDPDAWTQTEGHAIATATARLDQAIERIRDLGAEVSGAVGDERPLDAARDVLSDQSFDEVIVSTLPPGVSRWLGMDVVSRLERLTDVPVAHIVADSEDA
jgi:pentose-5-phosphate-3-epimerase